MKIMMKNLKKCSLNVRNGEEREVKIYIHTTLESLFERVTIEDFKT